MKSPERKQNRIKGYDYSQNGAYFITVCTNDRENMLWKNTWDGDVILNESLPFSDFGLVTELAIRNIPNHYNNVCVDKYVVMPNHVHMILLISGEDAISESEYPLGRTLCAPTVSNIIKHMKEFVTKQIGYPIWQKSFQDHIIRNEQDYQEIWEYIDNNPLKWKDDC